MKKQNIINIKKVKNNDLTINQNNVNISYNKGEKHYG